VATVTIDAIAAGGDGIGRVNELAVFVPRTAPGDVAQIAYRQHGRLGRGRVLQLLTASPARVDAACPHYEADQCGGCQLQHLSSDAQRHARQVIVQDALQRIGKRSIPLPSLTSGVAWGYRSRLTVALRKRGRGWVGGLHAHHDATRVFALTHCPIAHPALVQTWLALSAVMRAHPLPEADTLRLAFRLERDERGEGVAIVVQGGRAWPQARAFGEAAGALVPAAAESAAESAAEALASAFGVTTVWWLDDGGRATPCWSRSATLTPAPDADEPREEGSAADYVPAADEALAFAQVNASLAESLRESVYTRVMAFAPQRVVDGYAGVGALTERLALGGVASVAIEADAAGANAATARLAAHDADVRRRARIVCDTVERALPSLGEAAMPDVVVLNPPRRGVDARVTAWLDAAPARVRGVVYVSCNPATLARDLARLRSWEVLSVECFDMFPQTAHVESVCVLQRSQRPEAE
jgi:23S rRNA (uracil1939-C5)-methyltransferase